MGSKITAAGDFSHEIKRRLFLGRKVITNLDRILKRLEITNPGPDVGNKEMGIPDLLTCLLRNLYAGQEATVRTGHGTTDWFQIGKRVCQDCILSPFLSNLYAEYIMRNAGLKEAQAGIKIAR